MKVIGHEEQKAHKPARFALAIGNGIEDLRGEIRMTELIFSARRAANRNKVNRTGFDPRQHVMGKTSAPKKIFGFRTIATNALEETLTIARVFL